MSYIGKTYKVIDEKDGGCLNHVTLAPTEHDRDDVETREAKRKAHAEELRGRWQQTLFIDTNLKVVEVG